MSRNKEISGQICGKIAGQFASHLVHVGSKLKVTFDNLGDYTYPLNIIDVNRAIDSDGSIEYDIEGLAIANCSNVILYANPVQARPLKTDFLYVAAGIYYATDNTIKCIKGNGVSESYSIAFSSVYKLRLKRQSNTISYDYYNGTSWVALTTKVQYNILYTGLIFYDTGIKTVKNVTVSGNISTPRTSTILGDYTATSDTVNLNQELAWDGSIKMYATGLAFNDIVNIVLFFDDKEELTTVLSEMSCYMYWFSGDQKLYCRAGNTTLAISDFTFDNSYILRLRRLGGVMYYEYSTNDVDWTTIVTSNINLTLYAGLNFFGTSARNVKSVTVDGTRTVGYTTISNADYRFFKPNSPISKVVMYVHGSGEDEDAPISDALKIATIRAILNEGIGVISAYAAGNNWGNQASVTDYYNLITWAKTVQIFTKIDIMGQSMGGLTGAHLFLTDVQFEKFLAIYPAFNLAWCFTTSFKAAIKTAYGFVDDADYLTETEGYDPILFSGNLLNNRKIQLTASSSDTTVSKAYNTDAFIANFGEYAEIKLFTATGEHGNTSHFYPFRDIIFLKS